ncbi:MAG: type II toxin-antitoxin system RelE/ParE family toxin [Armatimonadota bacterium]|jgi:mRNA interferase RelE/StbE
MRLVIRPAARRDLGRLAPEVADRVEQQVGALEYDPRPPGCLLLRGQLPSAWRIRVGDWRIIYDISDEAGVVTILPILHRSVAYRH